MGLGLFGFGRHSGAAKNANASCDNDDNDHDGHGGHGAGHHGGGHHGGGHHGGQNDHHGGQHGGHHGGGHDWNLPGGDGCDDDSTSGGDTGPGNSFPDIPADTSGITFAIDLDGDGVMDEYIPIGRASDLKTFEDYYTAAKEDLLAEHPDVNPADVVIKATITSRSGDETHYYFTGDEETATDADDCDDDNEDDHGEDDHGHGGHGHGDKDDDHKGHGGRGNDDDDRADCGDDGDDDRDDHGDDHASGKGSCDPAEFFANLMACDSDKEDQHAEDDDSEDDHADFEFC